MFMSYLIDRRLNGKNKSTVNRQRFMRRYRQHIKKAVADAVSKRSITDIEQGEKITIPSKDVQEPVLGHGPGGRRTIVSPGNHDFIAGDKIPRPQGGAGGGGGKNASDSGEGVDDFVFQISQSEFLEFMFDDLALPNLVKRQLAGTESFKYRHGGFTTAGTPNQINVVRSLRAANARRIALGAKRRKKMAELEAQLAQYKDAETIDRQQTQVLSDEIDALRKQLKKIPFLDDIDIRYNLKRKEPLPSSKALMFCIMDVSGSMDQATKEKAKRFFILLYLFLKRNYQHIEVVFIRHHTSAKEVDEEEFFYSRETGGTIVSSALNLTYDIISKRYPVSEWNIYAAQASDGDNWNDDSSNCRDILKNQLLPLLQHFCYVEITPREHQSLWHEYEQLAEEFPYQFAMQQIVENHDIYPVFRELFRRREHEPSY
jgi:hypothetical protein